MIKANLVNEIPHAVSSNANHKGKLKWELHYKFNLQVKEIFKFCVNFQAVELYIQLQKVSGLQDLTNYLHCQDGSKH